MLSPLLPSTNIYWAERKSMVKLAGRRATEMHFNNKGNWLCRNGEKGLPRGPQVPPNIMQRKIQDQRVITFKWHMSETMEDKLKRKEQLAPGVKTCSVRGTAHCFGTMTSFLSKRLRQAHHRNPVAWVRGSCPALASKMGGEHCQRHFYEHLPCSKMGLSCSGYHPVWLWCQKLLQSSGQ